MENVARQLNVRLLEQLGKEISLLCLARNAAIAEVVGEGVLPGNERYCHDSGVATK